MSRVWLSVPVVAAGLLTACSSAPGQSGVRIGDETLKQFEVGVTTEAWLLAILGEPTEQAPVENIPNTKVLRYSLEESSSGLASVLSGSSRKNTAVVYFVVTDGIVTRYWADRATERTITGSPVEEPSGVKEGNE